MQRAILEHPKSANLLYVTLVFTLSAVLAVWHWMLQIFTRLSRPGGPTDKFILNQALSRATRKQLSGQDLA